MCVLEGQCGTCSNVNVVFTMNCVYTIVWVLLSVICYLPMQVCCCVAVLCVYLFLLLRDDDMISLASMMSVSNLSMIGNLEEDEEFNIW